MAPKSNKATFRRFYTDVINKGKLELVDEIAAENYVEHFSLPLGLAPGTEGAKQLFGFLRRVFPDLEATIHDMLEDGNKVVARVTLSGTHRGEFLGIEPTNKRVSWETIDITRFSRGKAVEHWAVTDATGLFQQLGFVSLPASRQAGTIGGH